MAAVTRARIPVWALSYCTVGLVGYDACFTRRRSRVRTSDWSPATTLLQAIAFRAAAAESRPTLYEILPGQC